MSFDSNKDLVSGKIVVFGNILGFPGVNWAKKMTKPFKFGYVPLPLEHLILKYCSETAFVLWETTSDRNFSKLGPYRGEKKVRNLPKWWFHGCYIDHHENI